MTTSCPKCSKALTVEDIVIKVAHSVRKIQTCGRLVVQKKGRVIAQSVEAHGGVDVEGVLQANVVSGGPVKIGAKAEWKGDCSAPSLEVALGGRIERGYFVIRPEPAAGVPIPAPA
jgi:cytoskeletal protein CcmA (bactofilin family)